MGLHFDPGPFLSVHDIGRAGRALHTQTETHKPPWLVSRAPVLFRQSRTAALPQARRMCCCISWSTLHDRSHILGGRQYPTDNQQLEHQRALFRPRPPG